MDETKKRTILFGSTEQKYFMNLENRLISVIWHHVFLQTKSKLWLFFSFPPIFYDALCVVSHCKINVTFYEIKWNSTEYRSHYSFLFCPHRHLCFQVFSPENTIALQIVFDSDSIAVKLSIKQSRYRILVFQIFLRTYIEFMHFSFLSKIITQKKREINYSKTEQIRVNLL